MKEDLVNCMASFLVSIAQTMVTAFERALDEADRYACHDKGMHGQSRYLHSPSPTCGHRLASGNWAVFSQA